MSYARLDVAGLQWPCPDETHPGTPILHVDGFPLGDRAAFHHVEVQDAGEVATPEYPFVLMTGRSLYQFNAGTMTSRSGLDDLRASDALDVSEEDAGRLDVREGDSVRVTSRYGSAALPVHVTGRVAPGHLFATFHTVDGFVNRVTSPRRDAITGTPEYKVTAVRLDPIPPAG
jgi:formate dehydrogenase major subunit